MSHKNPYNSYIDEYSQIAALSVALFRALKFTARFVSILDVASLKPEADKYETSSQEGDRVGGGIFRTSTLMVANPKELLLLLLQLNHSHVVRKIIVGVHKEGLKRKGDFEFEMQLAMAISATNVETQENIHGSSDVKILNGNNSLEASTPTKRWKRIERAESASFSQGLSTSLGSRKVGSPLFWAEVYCDGENLTGKWVNVDAVNAIIDGEQKVEDAAASCKTSLRYVVAFAGSGAKDMTRRYCMKWYKIAPKRVNPLWCDSVLAPMRQLESGATGGTINLKKLHNNTSDEQEKIKASEYSGDSRSNHVMLTERSCQETSTEFGCKIEVESSVKDSFVTTRSSLEDMELETRPIKIMHCMHLKDGLPSIRFYILKVLFLVSALVIQFILVPLCKFSRQKKDGCAKGCRLKAMRFLQSFESMVLEFLKKMTVMRLIPKILNFMGSGSWSHCASPMPLMELCRRMSVAKLMCGLRSAFRQGLFTVNIARGMLVYVNAWHISTRSTTVHDGCAAEDWFTAADQLKQLPRVFAVAKRLEIDYAPAMVGFEFRNGHATFVFDGFVVCKEFKDAILEERRAAEEKKRNEAQAISRCYQLLSSIITRQKLNSYYGNSSSSQSSFRDVQDTNNEIKAPVESSQDGRQSTGHLKGDNIGTMYTASSGAVEVSRVWWFYNNLPLG
ncbi:DNA repair protein complementing XP-C cells-like protein isoform X2 [Hibiscus syriacus]|uniref:DNA repair protein complementing XP-C cells-like protein isoform X2 n=1 Tax=Hibiscus syriacus TaxID=106335 RepID=A0A6A2XC34_HIBSY|nr:DNA repair protein complementing XP-C cells-like protein isoform X2 [Hibiscus syriacus]